MYERGWNIKILFGSSLLHTICNLLWRIPRVWETEGWKLILEQLSQPPFYRFDIQTFTHRQAQPPYIIGNWGLTCGWFFVWQICNNASVIVFYFLCAQYNCCVVWTWTWTNIVATLGEMSQCQILSTFIVGEFSCHNGDLSHSCRNYVFYEEYSLKYTII